MRATVIRNGQHSGGAKFVEVQETPSSPPFAVPVSAELALGTVVDVAVMVVELPEVKEESLVGTDVSTSSVPQLVVPDSPIAGNEPLKDTAPSGQTQLPQPATEAEATPRTPTRPAGDTN